MTQLGLLTADGQAPAERGRCHVHFGDWREAEPTWPRPFVLVSDPPYGIAYRSQFTRTGRRGIAGEIANDGDTAHRDSMLDDHVVEHDAHAVEIVVVELEASWEIQPNAGVRVLGETSYRVPGQRYPKASNGLLAPGDQWGDGMYGVESQDGYWKWYPYGAVCRFSDAVGLDGGSGG